MVNFLLVMLGKAVGTWFFFIFVCVWNGPLCQPLDFDDISENVAFSIELVRHSGPQMLQNISISCAPPTPRTMLKKIETYSCASECWSENRTYPCAFVLHTGKNHFFWPAFGALSLWVCSEKCVKIGLQPVINYLPIIIYAPNREQKK